MTSSESFEGGKITIVHNDRVAFTTAGKLVNLLPAAYDYSGTVACVFADPPKSRAYMHQAYQINHYVSGERRWGVSSRCVAWVSVPAREWSQETVICPLPSPDIDFVVINARFSRISAPSHAWCGRPIISMVNEGVTIPFTGTVHLESGDPGLQRLASIVRSGSNLVLHQQESILNCAGSFGSWTDHPSGTFEYSRTDWRAVGTPGLPVWADLGAPWRRNDAKSLPDQQIPPGFLTTCDLGGAVACSVPSDPTNFGSTWAITIHAMFGVVSKAG